MCKAEEDKVYKYDEVVPIEGKQSTVWLVEFANGAKHLNVWHKDAKIEDVVEATKVQFTEPFTVSSIDVGIFYLYQTGHSLSNARKVNQDMEIVVDI